MAPAACPPRARLAVRTARRWRWLCITARTRRTCRHARPCHNAVRLCGHLPVRFPNPPRQMQTLSDLFGIGKSQIHSIMLHVKHAIARALQSLLRFPATAAAIKAEQERWVAGQDDDPTDRRYQALQGCIGYAALRAASGTLHSVCLHTAHPSVCRAAPSTARTCRGIPCAKQTVVAGWGTKVRTGGPHWACHCSFAHLAVHGQGTYHATSAWLCRERASFST